MRGNSPADTHVSTRDPHAREQKTKARRLGQDPQVRRGSEDRACAGSDSVDRRDHGLRDFAKVAHACAGHAREVIDLAGAHLYQPADDLVDVPSRTKTAALSPDHQHADLLASISQRLRQIADVRIDLERQGVQPVRPRERDRRDTIALLVVEVLPGLQGRRIATASISTSASGSKRERTSTSVVAGKCRSNTSRYADPIACKFAL